MVNNVNSRLLQAELIMNMLEPGKKPNEDEYKLLGVFEMLWNVLGKNQMLGHAMTIKDEFLTRDGFENLLSILDLLTNSCIRLA